MFRHPVHHLLLLLPLCASMRAGGGLDAFSRRAALASAASVASSGLLLPAATAAALPLPLELELLSQAEPYIVQPDSTKTLTPKVKPTSPDALVRSLVGKRAIFLGEHHNSAADHLLQAALIRRLHERTGGKEMAVGLEAVQRRFQPVLDDYLAGRITEAELEEGVEWKKRWFWPFEAYVPVFRACRELGVSLLALNVDSEDLSKVEVGGLPALPPATLSRYISDRDGFASFASTTAFKEYVAYIIKPSYAMHQQMGILRTTITGQSLEQDMTFRNFFSGRILWDEAMASASAAWCAEHPGGTFVGLVGADHVKFGCGVPARCARQLPGGLASTASVILNPRPIDTRSEANVLGERPKGFRGPDGRVSFGEFTLQIRYTPVAGDGGPPIIGSAPGDTTAAAAQQQARAGSSVLGLADYLV